MPRVYVLFLLFLLISCLNTLCPSIILPLFPKMAVDLSVDRVELKQSIAFITAGIFLSRVLVGVGVQSIDPKKIFMSLAVILAAGSLCSLHADNVQLFWLGEFLQGFGIGAAYPLIKVVVNEHGKEKTRKILSYVGCGTAFIFFLAPMIGAQFYEQWHQVFYVTLFSALAMLVLAFWIPSKKTVVDTKALPMPNILKTILSNRKFLAILAIYSIRYAGFIVFLSWLPFLLLEDLHLSHTTFAYLMLFPALGVFLGDIISAFSKAPYLKLIMVVEVAFVCAGIGLSVGGFDQSVSLWKIIGFGSLFCFGSALVSVQTNLMTLELFEASYVKHAMLFSSIVLNLTATLVTFFSALIKVNDDFMLGLMFLGVTLLNILFLWLMKSPKPQKIHARHFLHHG